MRNGQNDPKTSSIKLTKIYKKNKNRNEMFLYICENGVTHAGFKTW